MAALSAALALAAFAGGDLVVPAWDAPTPHDEVCVEVPKTLTSPYANNSRWGFVALPPGTPPAGGWPVLITLAIIDFAANASATAANGGRCGLDGVYPERGGGRGYAMTEEYAPFAPPNGLMSPCSCFTPSGLYNCSTHADDGHHRSPGRGCSFDILAGGMWFQRQKQYLVANGIAVMVVNTRIFVRSALAFALPASPDTWCEQDGWNLDEVAWSVGEDRGFFAALTKSMTSGGLGPLNPQRVGFHGWSGGAQMVSNLVDVWARGALP